MGSRGGVVASHGDGIGDSLVLCLGVGKVVGYWLGQSEEKKYGGCAHSVVGLGDVPGGGVGAFLIPFIKYFPVFFIKSKVCPQLQEDISIYFYENDCNVLR